MTKNQFLTPPYRGNSAIGARPGYESPDLQLTALAASGILCTSDRNGSAPDLDANDDLDIFA